MQAHSGWVAAHVPGHGWIGFDPHPMPTFLDQGSLMLEFALVAREAEIPPLAHVTGAGAAARFFALGFTAEGQISVMQRQGTAFHALSIEAGAELAAGGPMRLTWRWDCRAGESVLVIEALDRGSLRYRLGGQPLPMARDDLMQLTKGTGAARIGARVDWLAFGDHLHPVGIGAGLAPMTRLATPSGWRPAASLQPGDLVETVDAGVQPVLWSGRVTLPTLGQLRPVRLTAPHFGARADLWVAPGQPIAQPSPNGALVEARHLVDGRAAVQPDRPNLQNWHAILLDAPHLMIAEGCRVLSLDIAAMNRQPALTAISGLADLARRGALPDHSGRPSVFESARQAREAPKVA